MFIFTLQLQASVRDYFLPPEVFMEKAIRAYKFQHGHRLNSTKNLYKKNVSSVMCNILRVCKNNSHYLSAYDRANLRYAFKNWNGHCGKLRTVIRNWKRPLIRLKRGKTTIIVYTAYTVYVEILEEDFCCC